MTIEQKLTWEEIDQYGTPIASMTIGQQFVAVVANREGTAWEETVGRVVEHWASGSVLVEFRRSKEMERTTWIPETRVIKL